MRPVHVRSIFAIFLVSMSSLAPAQIANPAKSITDVSAKAVPETVRQLSQARVVLADYDLVRRDFPEVLGFTTEQIDSWLLKYTAFISIPQLQNNGTNTEIPVVDFQAMAYRPPDYNRALVFRTAHGLIDSKGNGSLYPYKGGHSNGLATLGEAIREFLYQKLVQKVFDHSHSGLRTVGNYGVIDFGFNVIHQDGNQSRAGAILRQAHTRAPGHMSTLTLEQSLRIEALLREYGMTTTGTKRGLSYDLINAQGTTDGAAIDFGGFLVVNDLVRPAAAFLPDAGQSSPDFFIPGTESFIHPNPDFKIPYELWGSSVTRDDDSKSDNPFVWSHELAESLAQGTAQRKDSEQHVRNLLEPIARLFAAHPHPLPQTCENLFR